MKSQSIIALVLFSSILSCLSSSGCQVKVSQYTAYPTPTENLAVEMSSIFIGQNLTYSIVGNPSTLKLYNYFTPVDEYQSLPQGFVLSAVGLQLSQTTELWKNLVAVVGTISSGKIPMVYIADLSYTKSPQFNRPGVPLLIGQYTLHVLPSITYIGDESFIVDTWTTSSKNIGALMINQWQIVKLGDEFPTIVESTNQQNTQGGLDGFNRQTQYWQSHLSQTSYLLRGTLGIRGGVSYLEIFVMQNGIPQSSPADTITSSNITNMQMTDFYIANDGVIYILNYTQSISRYTINEGGNVKFVRLDTYQLDPEAQYLSIDVEVDYKAPVDYSYAILLSSTDLVDNVIEFIMFEGKYPQLVGFYTVPVQMQYSGLPPQIDVNQGYVSVQYDNGDEINQAYIFERGTPSFDPFTFKVFRINYVYSFQSDYAALNEIPSAMISFTLNQAAVSLVQSPRVYGKFGTSQTSGTVSIVATSNSGENQTSSCLVDIFYKELPITDTSIQYANQNFDIPVQILFPLNQTLDLSKYINGPAIQVSGTVQTLNEGLGLERYPSTSQIIPTTVQPLSWSAPQDYPKTADFLYTSYNQNDDTYLQITQSGVNLSAFVCYGQNYTILRTCYLVYTYQYAFTVTKIEAMFPISSEDTAYAYFFLKGRSFSGNYINVIQISWNPTELKGGFESLEPIVVNYLDKPVFITDYTVIDQQLYLTLASINQIWEYSAYVSSSYPTHFVSNLQITNADLDEYLSNGFQPIAVTGNYEMYGPVLFINNQVEFIIVSTLNDIVRFVSATEYPLTSPQLNSQIQLCGQQMIVVQYNASTLTTVQSITSFSLRQPYSPLLIKTLPLYGGVLQTNPLQFYADDHLFYIVMSDNSINVYKPSAGSHESLLTQIDAGTLPILLTATNDDTFSYITIGNSSKLANIKITPKIEAVFQPGQYQVNNYYTDVQFTLFATNKYQPDTNLNATNNVTIFNSQIAVVVDEQALNGYKSLRCGTGYNSLKLQPIKFMQGAVEKYTIDCELCRLGNITIQNRIQRGIQIQSLAGADGSLGKPLLWVGAMTMSPFEDGETLIASDNGLYLADKNLNLKLYTNFQTIYDMCHAVGASSSQQVIFTGCTNSKTSSAIIATYYKLGAPQTSVVTTSDFTNPTWIQILGNTVFILGVRKSGTTPTINVYTYSASYPLVLTQANIAVYQCSSKYDNSVNDFEITLINSFTDGGQNYNLYLLIYTCTASNETPYYVSLLMNTATQQVTLSANAPMIASPTTSFRLLVDTYFYQIQPITSFTNGTLGIVLTTSNIMDFVLKFEFNVNGLTSSQFTPKITSMQQVSTLPPYGNWQAINALTYADGLLLLPYNLASVGEQFVALYDLTNLNLYSTYSSPQIMVGGFTQPYSDESVYQIQGSNPNNRTQVNVLTSGSSYDYNLSTIQLNQQILINVDYNKPFNDQKIQILASNYYDSQSFQIDLAYQSPPTPTPTPSTKKDGLKWWGILLIILAIIAVIGLGSFGYFKYKQAKTYDAPLLS